MRAAVVMAVARTTFREFWRSPEAVFWTYGFPVVMAIVLGFAFQPRPPEPVPVAVVGADAAVPLATALRTNPRLEVAVLDAREADAALARGRINLLLQGSPESPVLRSDPARPESELARLLVMATLRDHLEGTTRVAASLESEDRPGSRYIDFLIPGLIGINLLGAGMWGVGFNLVQMRHQRLLRRLLVTPMRRSEFLGVLVFGVPFRGDVLAVLGIVFAGALAFTALGMLIASRARTIEGAGGLMNLCMIPMWLLGGSFFSNERFSGFMAWAAQALPLTWCNAGLRDCMLEPRGFDAALQPIGLLAAFTAVSFALALWLFRWK
jgi:ABC-type multidrug transport system permease subunit